MTIRLAVVSSHPIQYNAPLFKALAAQSDFAVQVFYGWRGATEVAFDPGFNRDFVWDTPLLDGYEYQFVENVAKQPGSYGFRGIILPELNTLISSWRPDAILIYGWAFQSHLAAMRHFKGKVPVFFRGDSTLIDFRTGIKKRLRKLFLTWVYRHIDIALAVGSNNIDYFRFCGVPDARIKLVRHAVDNDFFSSQDEERSQAARRQRQQLGIGENDVVFLFVGKLESKKAPDVLLNACRILNDPRAHVVIAGSGPLEGALKRTADDRVHFIGFQNQTAMPVVYRIADVLVLPSRGPNETWGLVINEAMACSRPVIASSLVGAARDLVLPKNTGWVVSAESADSLAGAMQDALGIGRPALCSLGESAQRLIRSFSIEQQVTSLRNAVASHLRHH